MTATAAAANPSLPIVDPVPLPLREWLPWAAFGLLIAAILLYFVGVEQGALSIFSGHHVHEFMHDGRHLLGFPCH